MRKQIVSPADACPTLLQEIHHSQICHWIDPEHARRVRITVPQTSLYACLDQINKAPEHGSGFIQVRTEVDGQHLCDQHLQGRQGTHGCRVYPLSQSAEQGADLIRPGHAGAQRRLIKSLSRACLQRLSYPVQF